MSVKRQRNLWRTGFLVVTVGALVMELFASFDGNSSTDPWTELITTYIPWEVFVAVLGGLIVWIIPHFYVRYRRRTKKATLQKAAYLIHQDMDFELFAQDVRDNIAGLAQSEGDLSITAQDQAGRVYKVIGVSRQGDGPIQLAITSSE